MASSVECKLLKVDIRNEDLLDKILKFLKLYLPETLYIYHLLLYIKTKFILIEHINPEIFLNDIKEIKCIIIIYSLYGFSSIKKKTEESEKLIIFHSDYHNIDLLELMMKQCLPWNTSNKFIITANGKQFLSMIKRFHQSSNLHHIEYCLVMQIDRTTFEKIKLKIQHIPNGIDIHPLSLIDAEFINNCWSDKSEDSLGQIKYQIEHLPTLGAYRNGKLISWRLLQYNGSLGMAYTIEQERRQGLSSILNIKLADKVFQHQDYVFCTVIQKNQSSIQLLTKLNYQHVIDEYWLFH